MPRRVDTTPILFETAKVKQVLARLPCVAARLQKPPEDEGVASLAFPETHRKTNREVYRWLANTHYDHLAEGIGYLERTHAAGCAFGELLRTSDRELFNNHVAEVLVAADLIRRGYEVTTVSRADGRTPDLHVRGRGVDVGMEVYCPAEMQAVDAWLHVVKDTLNFADVPLSYRWEVATRHGSTAPPDPSQFDPWATAMMLAHTRGTVIAELRRDVDDALRDRRPLSNIYEHTGTSLRTRIEITDVDSASAHGPERIGTFSPPGFGGYSPAGVFRKVVAKSLDKAEQRQTTRLNAAARALVVYLGRTQITQDLVHPAHHNQARALLEEMAIEPAWYGLDVIAFVVRALPEGTAAIFVVADDRTLTIQQVRDLFDQSPP